WERQRRGQRDRAVGELHLYFPARLAGHAPGQDLPATFGLPLERRHPTLLVPDERDVDLDRVRHPPGRAREEGRLRRREKLTEAAPRGGRIRFGEPDAAEGFEVLGFADRYVMIRPDLILAQVLFQNFRVNGDGANEMERAALLAVFDTPGDRFAAQLSFENEWAISPGQFKVYLGCCKTDLRQGDVCLLQLRKVERPTEGARFPLEPALHGDIIPVGFVPADPLPGRGRLGIRRRRRGAQEEQDGDDGHRPFHGSILRNGIDRSRIAAWPHMPAWSVSVSDAGAPGRAGRGSRHRISRP